MHQHKTIPNFKYHLDTTSALPKNNGKNIKDCYPRLCDTCEFKTCHMGKQHREQKSIFRKFADMLNKIGNTPWSNQYGI